MPRLWLAGLLAVAAGSAALPSSQGDRDVARQALLRGDGIAAEVALRKVLAAGAPRESVAAGMGEAWFLQGDQKRARDWLGQAQFSPDTAVQGLRALGQLEQAEGNFDGANAAFTRALTLAPRNSGLWLAIGRLRYASGDQMQAIEAADKAVQFDPANPWALEFRGQILRDQLGPAAALPWFEAAAARLPDNLELMGEHAATLGDAGRTVEMLALARRMIELSPDHPRALYLQAVIAARAGKFDVAKSIFGRIRGRLADRPAVLLFAGCLELEAGNTSTAIEVLGRLLRKQPANQRAQELLARAYAQAGRNDDLIRDFAALANQPGASPYLLVRVARAYEDQGRRDAAAVLLDRAVQNRPAVAVLPEFPVEDPAPDTARQIRRLLSSGNAGAAAQLAESQVAVHPGFAAAQSLAGDVDLFSSRTAAAVNRYALAANVRTNADLLLRWLYALGRSGRQDTAAALASRFVAGNPNDPLAARLAANQAAVAGNWELARTILTAIADRNGGSDVRLLTDLSYAQLRAGDSAAALGSARAAYALQPASPLASLALGQAMTAQRVSPRSARSLLLKARKVGGPNPEIDRALASLGPT